MKLFPVMIKKKSYKNLLFGTTLYNALLVARWDAAQFMNCLIKPSRSSKRKERNEEKRMTKWKSSNWDLLK